MKTPLLGTAYLARSSNLSSQQMINLFPEFVETKQGGKEVGALYMCPGLDLYLTAGNGPVRGLHVTGIGTQTLYLVSGSGVYSVTVSGVTTKLGTITSSSGPVYFIDNGTQTAFFDGAQGYLISAAGVLSTISLPFAFPTTATFQDGFGIANQNNSTNWYQSNLNDLSTWSSLNFATSAAKPTSVVALFSINREIWVFKTTNIEVWINAGNSGFTFQRLDGVFPEFGCLAAASVAKAGESLLWLGQNDQGQAVVFRSAGHNVQRMSTHAIEFAISQYATPSDAIGYAYQQEGHLFYVLTFVAGNATWVLDMTSTEHAGVPVWHQRAALSNGQLNRHWGNCFAFFNGLNLIGDYLTGNIYAFNMNTATDNVTQRKWLRSWRAMQKPTIDPTRFSSMQIDMETGIGVPDGTNPQAMLRWSDDGGHTWSNQRLASVGQTGKTAARVKFKRLGSTRRNSGLDRVFELSSSDQFTTSIIGADIT